MIAQIAKRIIKARRKSQAELKVAQTRAEVEVKEAAKNAARQQKLLANAERQLLKTEAKGLKRRRKHELKLAKAEVEKLKHGKFNASTVNRYATALRTAAPLLLPLAYRGIMAGREALERREANRTGVTPDQLAAFAGFGASLKARAQGIRNTVEHTNLPSGFKRDVKDRLNDIDAAIDNAENMSSQQRRRAHNSISSDLNALSAEIQAKL